MYLCVDAVCLDFNLGVRPAATLVIALQSTSPGRSTVMQSANASSWHPQRLGLMELSESADGCPHMQRAVTIG
jgi:hypothetical protein